MKYYGVDTAPIDRLGSLAGNIPSVDPVNWASEDGAPLGNASPDLCAAIVMAYVDAFDCLLHILHGLMQHRLSLLAKSDPRTLYQRNLLPVYLTTIRRVHAILTALFREILAQGAPFAQDVAAQILASGTIPEMTTFVTIPEAPTAAETKEDGEVGKQITDSVKRLLRALLMKIPALKTRKKRKEWVDHSLHAVNEVLGIVFRTAA